MVEVAGRLRRCWRGPSFQEMTRRGCLRRRDRAQGAGARRS